MDETPDERRGPDEHGRAQQSDPAAMGPSGVQEPPPDKDDDEEDDDDEFQAPSRRRILSGWRLAAAGVAVVVLLGGGAALAFGGGGGSDNDEASSSDDKQAAVEDAGLEFAQCMRDHGFEDFPDPQVDADGGITIGKPESVIHASREKWEAANEACDSVLNEAKPEGQQLTPDEVAELQDQALAMAQCMRDRGYNFPDPQVDENGNINSGVQDNASGGPGGPGGPGDDQFQQDQDQCSEQAGLGTPDAEGGSGHGGEGGG
jgi:hypothetical protein